MEAGNIEVVHGLGDADLAQTHVARRDPDRAGPATGGKRQIEGQSAEIVGAMSEVPRISETIATSIGEQQRDMEAVDGSLNQITGVMQQNTEAAKASSDASDMLASQTATLHALLGKFRLKAVEKAAGAVERAAA